MIRAFIAKYEVYFAIGLCVFCLGYGWYLHGIFYEAKEKRDLEAQVSQHMEAEKAANEKSAKLETELATAREANAKLNDEVKNETKKPAYNCIVPNSGKLLINKALASNSAR